MISSDSLFGNPNTGSMSSLTTSNSVISPWDTIPRSTRLRRTDPGAIAAIAATGGTAAGSAIFPAVLTVSQALLPDEVAASVVRVDALLGVAVGVEGNGPDKLGGQVMLQPGYGGRGRLARPLLRFDDGQDVAALGVLDSPRGSRRCRSP